MNFLAHIYLSGSSEEILTGNFIGDYVKGSEYKKYPPLIGRGILLHRNIDSFTDHHKITRECKLYISDRYGKYSGIVVDIFYDHFLSANWTAFSNVPLPQYISSRYEMLESQYHAFPDGVKSFFPYFVESDWLTSYGSLDGLESVLRRMSVRTSLPDHSGYAASQLRKHHAVLEKKAVEFLHEVTDYVKRDHQIDL